MKIKRSEHECFRCSALNDCPLLFNKKGRFGLFFKRNGGKQILSCLNSVVYLF